MWLVTDLISNFGMKNGVANNASKTFPTIFELVLAKDAAIDDLLVFFCGFPQWNGDVIRIAQSWELEIITEFFVLLYSVRETEVTLDKIILEPFQE